ncbi:LysR family transcriptional regulator [Sphingomonas glacialis]|uniref:LysR family transcriptional regulator n=1 Tax=Sphingomonas glacialis TaxID=658225 RepID=A0A502FRK4_9SPHN|nr:LysR family transcriptional regulator [Sphingomonas glacialis]TPG52064.1 LysR family transcriptional regulator [Sphingomonas glacialis]
MKDISALRLYVRVARLGSFSAAARECGLAQSQASRIIADLEADLGARLLSRTTRAVVPTEAGAEFLARIEPILLLLEEAEQSVREDGELHGLLRVGMPASFGNRVVLPALSGFVERHPRLTVQVMLEDKVQDMVREAVDVGIRIGELPDATGTTKLLATVQRVIVAAPRYLEARGAPSTPHDLVEHRIIGGPAAAQSMAWTFERDGTKQKIELQPNILVNDTSGAVVAATSSLGITSTTLWACERELDAGYLVRVLPDWWLSPLPVHAYFPMGRATRKAARAFVDFLIDELHRRPGSTPAQ